MRCVRYFFSSLVAITIAIGAVSSSARADNSGTDVSSSMLSPKAPNVSAGKSFDVAGIMPGQMIEDSTGDWILSLYNHGSGVGLQAKSDHNWGVVGFSEDLEGILGFTRGQGKAGVLGIDENDGVGVSGRSSAGDGVFGASYAPLRAGVAGNNNAGNGVGVSGRADYDNNAKGVWGFSLNGTGVYGQNFASDLSLSGVPSGVYGRSESGNGNGVTGEANNGPAAFGVFGKSTQGWAGYFQGKVQVTGNLEVHGTLVHPAGSVIIDHPLDPANKYLYHSAVESPDMMNIYNGNVTLDAHGEAIVTMPDWFGSLNRDFRYQLTNIGAFSPVYVAEEIDNNHFKIAGGKSGGKVSWQVTGVRKDPYAEKNRIPVEQDKAANEKGNYLHPEVYGQPMEKSIEKATGR